ncbi:MAG: hypothetical protein QXK89_06810 [Candidatus Bathyarchaeia archaeon]
MVKVQRETAEIIAGALLLILSFLISFFMVIGILEKSITLSVFSLSSSFAGLTIGFHGIYGVVISRRKKE